MPLINTVIAPINGRDRVVGGNCGLAPAFLGTGFSGGAEDESGFIGLTPRE